MQLRLSTIIQRKLYAYSKELKYLEAIGLRVAHNLHPDCNSAIITD